MWAFVVYKTVVHPGRHNFIKDPVKEQEHEALKQQFLGPWPHLGSMFIILALCKISGYCWSQNSFKWKWTCPGCSSHILSWAFDGAETVNYDSFEMTDMLRIPTVLCTCCVEKSNYYSDIIVIIIRRKAVIFLGQASQRWLDGLFDVCWLLFISPEKNLLRCFMEVRSH